MFILGDHIRLISYIVLFKYFLYCCYKQKRPFLSYYNTLKYEKNIKGIKWGNLLKSQKYNFYFKKKNYRKIIHIAVLYHPVNVTWNFFFSVQLHVKGI